MEAKHVESIKLKAKVFANTKIWYSNAFLNLILTQFSGLIYVLKASYNGYRRSTAAKYYEILKISYLRNKFVEKLLEKLK